MNLLNSLSTSISGAILCVAVSCSGALAEACSSVVGADGTAQPALVMRGRPIPIEPAFEDYTFMLFDACEAWELSVSEECTIFPMMGEIEHNAVAAVCDGNPVIVYDRRLSRSVGGYEGAQAVMAHELAHHVCGHLNGVRVTRAEAQAQELEADRFAGATMRRLGFSREKALGYLSLLANLPLVADLPTSTHPAKARRRTELLAGWDDTNSTCLGRRTPSPN